MACTDAERLEIERETRDRIMGDITTGNFQIHGMTWDTIIAGIQNMRALVPGNVEKRVHEIVRLKAAEEALEAAEAVYGWSDTYEDWMGPDDFEKRNNDRARFVTALAKFKELSRVES